jgi:hypothetical protein
MDAIVRTKVTLAVVGGASHRRHFHLAFVSACRAGFDVATFHADEMRPLPRQGWVISGRCPRPRTGASSRHAAATAPSVQSLRDKDCPPSPRSPVLTMPPPSPRLGASPRPGVRPGTGVEVTRRNSVAKIRRKIHRDGVSPVPRPRRHFPPPNSPSRRFVGRFAATEFRQGPAPAPSVCVHLQMRCCNDVIKK